MKKILVFRSAKHPLMEECIKKINEENGDCKIWLCIQEQCTKLYSKYENIHFIVFPNGMFSYERTVADQMICDALLAEHFDEVYIPYSSVLPKCEEIEKIIVRIVKKRKVIYYDRAGNMERKGIYVGKIKPRKILQKLSEGIEYTAMKLIYLYFAGRGKSEND